MPSSELSDFLHQNVDDSVVRHGFNLSPEGREYLRDFLGRFIDIARLFHEYQSQGEKMYGLKPITFQHFEALQEKGLAQKSIVLQQLAEECLFLVGYCYDFVRRNGAAQVRFHSNMGAAAYDSLAALTGQQVFPEVAESFSAYSVVVGDLHIPELKADNQRFKHVLDQWLKTRDKRYELLIEGVLGQKGIVAGMGFRPN